MAQPDLLRIEKQPNGVFLPTVIKAGSTRNATRVCPFSTHTPVARKEIGLGKSGDAAQVDDLIGSFVYLGAGRVKSDDVWQSSSGGLTSWLLTSILRSGEVDGVIHLGDSDGQNNLFEYRVSRTVDEILQNRGSKYYASHFADVLETVRHDKGKYVFVGVPCFVNAIDLLRAEDPLWQDKIVFTVGLVCGHLKTQVYTEALAWQLGLSPVETHTVDYRVKDSEAKSSDYLFGVKNNGVWSTERVKNLVSSNWGETAFSLQACNSCTDLFGYSSDVTLGDAWLERYENESRGTNIVVVRNPRLLKLFVSGQDNNELHLDKLEISEILRSQLGGIRHRIEGYAVRNSERYRKASPQSDNNFQSYRPRWSRRLVLKYRAHISKTTWSQMHLNEKGQFKQWLRRYKKLRTGYKLLELLTKLSPASVYEKYKQTKARP